MKSNFQIGDKVERTQDEYNKMVKGDTDIVKEAKEGDNSLTLSKYGGGHCQSSFKVLERKAKLKVPTHLVVWEEDTDPCRFFTSEKSAKEFIKELSGNSDVEEGSIVLVEVKSAQKVNVSKSLKYSGYKTY